MHRPKTIIIGGRPYAWRDIVELRRAQIKAERQPQPVLFEMIEDRRPKSQQRAAGRYAEPTLF